MTRFLVTLQSTSTDVWLVEAASPDKAFELARQGKGSWSSGSAEDVTLVDVQEADAGAVGPP